MKLTLTIQCDNATFEEYPAFEVGRILRRLAEKMQDIDYGRSLYVWQDEVLRDGNGNTVGRVQVED